MSRAPRDWDEAITPSTAVSNQINQARVRGIGRDLGLSRGGRPALGRGGI